MCNPFEGYGRLVSGERFVGRAHDLRRLQGRLERFSGSLSVVGEQRIGKTSLVHNALANLGADVSRVVWITLSSVPSLACVHTAILEELGATRPIGEADLYAAYRALRLELRRACRAGRRMIVVLDEFDAVTAYSDARLFSQQLRELIDFQSDTGLLCVFISRRTLFHLEHQMAGVSNLDGICEKLYVRPLGPTGLDEMWKRCAESWAPTDQDRATLLSCTGGHPYLAEMVLCRGWERGSVAEGLAESRSDIYQHYERLRGLLAEDGLFDALVQLTVGPRLDNSVERRSRLISYGILADAPGAVSRLVGWSEHFQSYLEMVFRETPLHDEWRQVESGLRELVEHTYRSKLGPDWLVTLRRSNAKAEAILCQAEMLRTREHGNFGCPDNRPILAYTYPMDIWSLITCNWPLFEPVLRHDRSYWGSRFDVLAAVRTPVGHTRDGYLPQSVVDTASGYCKEIMLLLSEAPRSEPS